MVDPRRVELDDLVNRPGTYFNPQTEVLIVVDDSPELDTEIFNMEEFEGADWVQISDELPVDEHRRDELLEASRSTSTPARPRRRTTAGTPPTSSRKTTRRPGGSSRRDASGRHDLTVICAVVVTARVAITSR